MTRKKRQVVVDLADGSLRLARDEEAARRMLVRVERQREAEDRRAMLAVAGGAIALLLAAVALLLWVGVA